MIRRNLTDAEVLAIYHSDEPGGVLAQRHGLSDSNVSRIRHGKLYRHVTGGVPRGRRITGSKLDAEKAGAIRQRVEAGEKQYALAAEYQVEPASISHIVNNRTWKGIP